LENRHLYILVTILTIIGLGSFFYKWLYVGVPLRQDVTTDIWTIDARISFTARNNVPVKFTFTIPSESPGFTVLDDNFVSRNYGITIAESTNKREATLSVRRASGKQDLFYRVILQRASESTSSVMAPGKLPSFTLSETEKVALSTLAQQIRSKSADTTTFVAEAIKLINDTSNTDAIELLGRNRNRMNIANTIVKLLTVEGSLHARVVQGMFLSKQEASVNILPWLSVYRARDKTWLYFNPETGVEELPDDFFVWSYNNQPLLNVEQGVRNPSLTFTTAVTRERALELFIGSRDHQAESNLLAFSLFSLPLDTQQTYKILLTIPIGAFMVLLMRSFIGIATFGTFMPVLIGLAFRDTGLLWGTVLFTLIVSLGLSVRFYLDKLHLLLIPRLSAILTVVIMIMAMISIVAHRLGFSHTLSVTLFPIVILTMVIERMCIMWEERGAKETLITALGSLLAASITFFAMFNEIVKYLLFVFPELLFVLLALTLLTSQYHGYRLSELIRFKALAQTNTRVS
jgi:hypothetical protein